MKKQGSLGGRRVTKGCDFANRASPWPTWHPWANPRNRDVWVLPQLRLRPTDAEDWTRQGGLSPQFTPQIPKKKNYVAHGLNKKVSRG